MKTSTSTILSAAIGGLLLGTASVSFAGCGPKETTAAAAMEKHACAKLNSCKNNGGCKTGDQNCKGKNTCQNKGGCNTADPHTCATKNGCKNQGGCKGTAGKNECSGKGGCAVPVAPAKK